MASIAASLAASGTSKSGRPIEKLIGSFILAARSKTLRMPEASTPKARREMYDSSERIKIIRAGCPVDPEFRNPKPETRNRRVNPGGPYAGRGHFSDHAKPVPFSDQSTR